MKMTMDMAGNINKTKGISIFTGASCAFFRQTKLSHFSEKQSTTLKYPPFLYLTQVYCSDKKTTVQLQFFCTISVKAAFLS